MWLWSQKSRRVWVRGRKEKRKGRGKPAGQQARSGDSRLGVAAGLATKKSQVNELGVCSHLDMIGYRLKP